MNNYKLKFSIGAAEYEKKFTFLKVEPKYNYENGKRTDKYDAFTLTFLADNEDILKVHVPKENFELPKRLEEYYIVFDEEKTKPYCQNGFVKYTVWAQRIEKGDE